ncbi:MULTISPECIES: alpha/beta fold hydrolase [Kitasatospora]|uniref:Epoxide hydrolase N-terminal domain-containing protein n=1 Tax=Kitasatospora cathayae TaxID=3004092 RepID=A0ABY7Q0P3_9ACTN|nr:alpha/beta fold hydrolase [Kitasatospora sp. HUAS 3-15]WBP86283.1 epoxide hydrolase N-terminal domain-containing protein [Kitasatospora sp. HUAS 3-15]
MAAHDNMNRPTSGRRRFLGLAAAGVVAGQVGLSAPAQAATGRGTASADAGTAPGGAPGSGAGIRPFRIKVAQRDLDDLRRRIRATRWPDRETVDDRSQGAQLAKVRPLMEYWGTGYDWRKLERRLNDLPQYITEIDGLDIQFAHIRSPHAGAMPMLMTHGWPGSIVELLKVIDPLTNPTAHGGRAGDAFHLVLPTLPGYGFSGSPTRPGWNFARIAPAFHELMTRLGYPEYVSQGGDHGAILSEVLAVQQPKGLLGIHVNMPGTVPDDVLRRVRNFDPAPANLSAEEKRAYDRLLHFYRDGFGYAAMMNQTPQTIAYSLTDSPVGMASYYYDKFAEWTDSGGEPEKVLTYDEMLDAISMYWLTRTGASSSRLYWEGARAGGGPFNAVSIPKTPVAVTVFPAEIYPAPRSWGERTFGNIIHWNEVDRGGHFAAWEQPQLLAEELRTAFRSLR